MEWKDVTPAGAKEKKHYRLSCWLLSIEALKKAFGDKYAIMVGLCVAQGLLHLPLLILSPQRDPLMPKAAISAL